MYNGFLPDMLESQCGVRYADMIITNHEHWAIHKSEYCKKCSRKAMKSLHMFIIAVSLMDNFDFHQRRRLKARRLHLSPSELYSRKGCY